MKTISAEELARSLPEVLEASQGEGLLIRDNGEVVAMLVGIRGQDADDVEIQSSPAFWQMVERWRREPTTRLADVISDLAATDPDDRDDEA